MKPKSSRNKCHYRSPWTGDFCPCTDAWNSDWGAEYKWRYSSNSQNHNFLLCCASVQDSSLPLIVFRNVFRLKR